MDQHDLRSPGPIRHSSRWRRWTTEVLLDASFLGLVLVVSVLIAVIGLVF